MNDSLAHRMDAAGRLSVLMVLLTLVAGPSLLASSLAGAHVPSPSGRPGGITRFVAHISTPAAERGRKQAVGTIAHVRVDRLRIDATLLGILVGLVTVALQVWLKFTSREPPDGKRHGLGREDLVWWIEWVVAAAVAFAVLALTTAGDGGSLSESQVIALVIVFLVGFSGLPGLVRAFGYNKGNEPSLRTFMGILVPNLLGAVILMVAVISGASLAG